MNVLTLSSLHELVKHDVNGLVFHTADQLSLQLQVRHISAMCNNTYIICKLLHYIANVP